MNNETGQLLDLDYTFITPTTRLSHALQYRFALEQTRQGKSAWKTPDILPWQGWLQRCWESHAFRHQLDQVLLSPHQQHCLWADIINRSPAAKGLLNTGQTARQAMQAWQVCREWQIPVFPDGYYIDEDAYAFLQWSEEYRHRCESNGWVDTASLATLLIRATGPIKAGEKLALFGFDDMTPLQRRLLERIAGEGSDIREISLKERDRSAVAYGFADQRAEIRAAALWAREKLETNPGNRIGIVVHNLNNLASQIKNTFEDVMQPGAILAGCQSAHAQFSISLGRPLMEYPLITDAMNILSLGKPRIQFEDFSSLLRSPFIKSSMAEGQRRAVFDAELRKKTENTVSFRSLQRLIDTRKISPDRVAPGFMTCYAAFDKRFRKIKGRQPATEWVRNFGELLKAFGWPGERPPDSNEFQLLSEWHTVLDQFARLDLIGPRLTCGEACMRLRQILMDTRFQPETPETPVQILGMNGAAAMQFDHLRVLGLHEEAWPGRAEPDVFIPVKLQREYALPRSSPDTLLQQAGQLLDRLVRSSADVVLSYPEREKDRELRPSALIREFLAEPYPVNTATDYASMQFAAGVMERVQDDHAQPIPRGERVRGGTALFRDQAACPFRAFAHHRLSAEGIMKTDIGLDALNRGSIAHAAAEAFWRRTGSLKNLERLTRARQSALVEQAVNETVNRFKRVFPFTFTERFTAIETERLKQLLEGLIGLERERRPFEVRECEGRHLLVINNIEIDTRIDRIDQLDDGRLVVIDYKTGSMEPKVSAWLGERPEEPQLPLYAVSTGGRIAAVAFIRLRTGELGFTGLAEDEDLLPGVKTISSDRTARARVADWDNLFACWKAMLDSLANDFRQGVATVDPKDSNTCTWCDLHSFCRIHELQKTQTGEGDSE